MKIRVRINNEDREFEIGKITGRLMLEHARLSDLMADDSVLAGKQADFYIDRCKFIVDCFEKRFTVDELLDGCESVDIDMITIGILNYITEKTENKIAKILKN